MLFLLSSLQMEPASFILFITLLFTISFMMNGENANAINPVCNSPTATDSYESLEEGWKYAI